MPLTVWKECTEEMLTIVPLPMACMCGMTYFAHKNCPFKLTARQRSQSSARGIQHGLVNTDTGVVHQDIDPPVVVQGFLDHRLDLSSLETSV